MESSTGKKQQLKKIHLKKQQQQQTPPPPQWVWEPSFTSWQCLAGNDLKLRFLTWKLFERQVFS